MSRHKVIFLLNIVLFLSILTLSFIFTDFIGGKVSNTENRMLASFPASIDQSTRTIDIRWKGMEQWISDNIGFRKVFVGIYSVIKNNILGLSSSPLVLRGSNGWYYYTADNNIEIAKGTYPLTEDDLAIIAKNQQIVSDFYHSLGKEYILMLVPSKVSIYPEFLPMADETVPLTPVDIVANYINKHTDVTVYNSKNILLRGKDEGQIYHKTDTHWNQLGSYIAYKGLYDVMKQQEIISGDPISVTFYAGKYRGEFSAMLGYSKILPAENTPIAQWTQSFYIVDSGSQFDAAKAIQKEMNPSFDCAILFNDSAPIKKTLQIYGDSQMQVGRMFPCYLAESFSEVFNFAIRDISPLVDDVSDPDVIVYSCSERYIQNLLTKHPFVPDMNHDISGIPTTNVIQDSGFNGMWLDTCNGQQLSQQGAIDSSTIAGKDFVTLIGWAADFSTMQPLSALYVKIGDLLYQCEYGLSRDSVSLCFGTSALKKTGFTITIPAEYLHRASTNEIQFIQVGSDGTYQFTPVKYIIS